MENSTASLSETLNSMPSTDYSSFDIENLLPSFNNLGVISSQIESNGTGTSQGNNNYSLAANGFLTRTQQFDVAIYPEYEDNVEDSILVPSSSYYSSIWDDYTLSNGGMTMSMTSGFGAPSVSNWVHRRNYGGLLDQQDLNDAGLYGKSYFELLQICDIFDMAMNQNGSRFLQRMLSLNHPKITSKIFEGVVDSIFKLITDQYGHHLFMKLIERCNGNQLQLIIAEITFRSGLLIDASTNKYGSNSITKLIGVLKNSPLISMVMSTLHSEFYEIMTNIPSSYVILKCLDILNTQKNELLYLAAIQHYERLATHEKGCISLNKFITNMKGPYRDQLLRLISENSVYLSQDPSGNYVVQHILGLQHPVFSKKICSRLKGCYIPLSLQISGSHVVEKCLDSPWMDHVIEDFLKDNKLWRVAQNEYGNYVIQKALRVTKHVNSPFYHDLLMKLQPHLGALQYNKHGRNVFNLVNNEVPSNKV